MAVTRETPRQTRLGFYWTGISIFILWNATTFAGALAGNAIGDPSSTASTPQSARHSWRCCGRASTWYARTVALMAAAVALGVVPVTAAGCRSSSAVRVAVGLGMLWQPEAPAEDVE